MKNAQDLWIEVYITFAGRGCSETHCRLQANTAVSFYKEEYSKGLLS